MPRSGTSLPSCKSCRRSRRSSIAPKSPPPPAITTWTTWIWHTDMRLALACALALLPSLAMAQDMPDMPGMSMPATDAMPAMATTGVLGPYALSRDASGTSWQPDAVPHAGIHLMADDWMVMLHASVTASLTSQSGPRGASMAFAQGWGMVMARRDFTNGDTLNLRAMLSLDPFMGRRGYPL